MTWTLSPELGWWERVGQTLFSGLPKIDDVRGLVSARELVRQGKSAYLSGTKAGLQAMMLLMPSEGGLLTVSRVPALHFVTNRGSSGRLDSFMHILRTGFSSFEGDDNAFLLTSGYVQESVEWGYPYDEKWRHAFMGPMNAAVGEEDGFAVRGDSLRVVLWAGFVRGTYIHENRLETGFVPNTVHVRQTPVQYVEGVVVTAPGSDWSQRVAHYSSLYRKYGCIAPLALHGDGGVYHLNSV